MVALFLSAFRRKLCVCALEQMVVQPPPGCHEHVPDDLVKQYLHLNHHKPES